MAGEKKIVGLWRDRPAEAADAPVGAEAAEIAVEMPENAAAASDWLAPLPKAPAPADQEFIDTHNAAIGRSADRWIASLLLMAAAGWTATIAWSATAGFVAVPTPDMIPEIGLTLAGPLAVLLLLWIVRLLSGRVRTQQFAKAAVALRRENDLLSESVAGLAAQLEAARTAMHQQGQSLQQFGLDAAARLHEGSNSLAASADQIANANAKLAQSGETAMQRMDGLLAGLPRVDDVAQRLAENFAQAGRVAHQHGANLEAQLALLTERAGAADDAVMKLMEQLSGGFRGMESQVEKLCNTVSLRSDAAAAVQKRALGLIAKEQEAIEARVTEALTALQSVTAEAREQLASGCEESLADLENRLAAATQTSNALAAQLADHANVADSMVKGLETAVVSVDQKLGELGEAVNTRSAAIGEALAGLAGTVDSFAGRTARGQDEVERLIAGSESLITALDAVTRELDESLPAAFTRLEAGAVSARNLVDGLAAPLAASADLADKVQQRLSTTETQATAVHAGLTKIQNERIGTLTELQKALTEAEQQLRELSNETDEQARERGTALLVAMQQVRDASESAASEARSLIEAAVSGASGTLRERAAGALDAALKSEIDAQLRSIELAADRAVSAANGAADKLMRQLITIMDASASVEQRIAEAETAIATTDRDTLAKQVVVLTDSLKSTAIDLTKILSSEVSDAAWDSYLKGDRGVFSRRAVKLIDNSESKEILRRYHDDADFQRHVNQYIHDFEAILRALMGTRDGSALSVTMLSSDVGKLYVALAQAIDRLRT